MAFPEIRLRVTVRLMGREARAGLQAVPAEMGRYMPFSELAYGSFYETDADSSVVLTVDLLRELGFRARRGVRRHAGGRVRREHLVSIPVDSIIGRKVEIVSSTLDIESVARTFIRSIHPAHESPREGGGRPVEGGRRSRALEGIRRRTVPLGCYCPARVAAGMPRLGLSDVGQLLDRPDRAGGYESFYVRTKDMEGITPVRAAVEEMGYGVLAIVDELDEIKQSFLIMDTLLGAVGHASLSSWPRSA